MDNILTDSNFVLNAFDPKMVAHEMANRLMELRLEQNITQAELSKKSAVSLGSIKRFERTNEISLKHLLQIALVLGALDKFASLFKDSNNKSFDELVSKKKRKRARNV